MPIPTTNEETQAARRVVGLILAGGRARRMGGPDKPFVPLGGCPLIERVMVRVAPQVAGLAIVAGGDAGRFARLGLPVVPDPSLIGAFAGPLAGVLAGLEWAATLPDGIEAVAVFPADTPFLPGDFVGRGMAALDKGAEVAMAGSADRLHPTVAVWRAALAPRLRRLVVEEDLRRADRLPDHFLVVRLDYAARPRDPFFNINTPEDLAAAEALLSGA